ncbi:MutS protein msh5 [Chytridiales sp. JEL 0842]|nr:MutS protein msh5 [Chytridiales sp. JEL 0842]
MPSSRRSASVASSRSNRNDLDDDNDDNSDDASTASSSTRMNDRESLSTNTALDSNGTTSRGQADLATRGGDEEVEEEHVILSLSLKGSTLGAAYIHLPTLTLYLLEDIPEDLQASGPYSHPVTRQILLQAKPRCILVNSRSADDALLSTLRESNAEVIIRPPQDFLYNTSRNRLLSLRVREFMAGNNMSERDGIILDEYGRSHYEAQRMILKMEGVVSLNAVEMVGAAGALLTHLSKSDNQQEFIDTLDGTLEILSLKQMNLREYMYVPTETLTALRIFKDLHSKPMKRNPDKKKLLEDITLHELLNKTLTPPGSALLKLWMLKPLQNLEAIEERLDNIEALSQPTASGAVENARSYLGHMRNVHKLLPKLKGAMGLKDWEDLLKFVYYALKLLYVSPALPPCSIILKIQQTFNASTLKHIGTLINGLIDFDASRAEAPRVVVKTGVDEELDERRRVYEGLDGLLSQVALEMVRELPPHFPTNLNVVYFPQLGFLVSYPLSDNLPTQEELTAHLFDFQFSTNLTAFFKHPMMQDLDETLGDVHRLIVDRETELVWVLQESLGGCGGELGEVGDLCAELDCLLALAITSRTYSWTRPTFYPRHPQSGDGCIEITEGWHPLLEASMEPGPEKSGGVVRNSVKLGNGEAKGMLVTGPNASGKSVLLQQVGLMVFLAHIGCFVPAGRMKLSVVDRILTRMQTVESASKVSSAFIIDLQQMNLILRTSTPHTLALIDEFGKGTSPTDGLSLLAASFESLTHPSRPLGNPFLLTTTHFHEILHLDILRGSESGWFSEGWMGYQLLNEESEGVGGEVVFMYRLQKGKCLRSLGMHCAALAGVPRNVVQRGSEVARAYQTGQEVRIIKSAEEEAEDRRMQAVLEWFSEWDVERGKVEDLKLTEVVSQEFTVGKVDAGMAILLSPDHHLIEFPATILPAGVKTGSIINITIERNQDEEQRKKEEFLDVQDEIYNLYSRYPEPPKISLRSVTQTSAIIQWDPLVLHNADLRGIDIYRNGQKLSVAVAPSATSAKLSGLDVDHEYDVWVVLRTSAGLFTSNHISVKTHTLDNLTGINVSFGSLSNDGEMDNLIQLLRRMGAHYTEELTTDNTHLVCAFARGPKYEKAVEWNIPAVSPEFLKACEQNGKVMPAHSYFTKHEFGPPTSAASMLTNPPTIDTQSVEIIAYVFHPNLIPFKAEAPSTKSHFINFSVTLICAKSIRNPTAIKMIPRTTDSMGSI